MAGLTFTGKIVIVSIAIFLLSLLALLYNVGQQAKNNDYGVLTANIVDNTLFEIYLNKAKARGTSEAQARAAILLECPQFTTIDPYAPAPYDKEKYSTAISCAEFLSDYDFEDYGPNFKEACTSKLKALAPRLEARAQANEIIAGIQALLVEIDLRKNSPELQLLGNCMESIRIEGNKAIVTYR